MPYSHKIVQTHEREEIQRIYNSHPETNKVMTILPFAPYVIFVKPKYISSITTMDIRRYIYQSTKKGPSTRYHRTIKPVLKVMLSTI